MPRGLRSDRAEDPSQGRAGGAGGGRAAAPLTELFNHLTGYSRQTAFRRLLVAPQGIRPGLAERIEAEITKARAGDPALIQIKVNALVSAPLVDQPYRASQAGVRVDLVVRGMCMLRPGMPRLSERIRVRSILGRFLEHSRIYRFGAGPDTAEWVRRSRSVDTPLLAPREELLRRAQTQTG